MNMDRLEVSTLDERIIITDEKICRDFCVGFLRTKDFINYLVNDLKLFTTNKPIEETSLKDLGIDCGVFVSVFDNLCFDYSLCTEQA